MRGELEALRKQRESASALNKVLQEILDAKRSSRLGAAAGLCSSATAAKVDERSVSSSSKGDE